jgi:hypothetical protein
MKNGNQTERNGNETTNAINGNGEDNNKRKWTNGNKPNEPNEPTTNN